MAQAGAAGRVTALVALGTAQHAPHAADDVKDPTPVHRAPAVQPLGALVAVALLPFLLRALILPVDAFYAASINALIFNGLAVMIAFWTSAVDRDLSRQPLDPCDPAVDRAGARGHRHRAAAGPPALRSPGAGGGLRRPYPVGPTALYFAVHRYIRHRIAIVLPGDVDRLKAIDDVEWRMQVPELDDAAGCDGLVVDFASPDAPPEWCVDGRRGGRRTDSLPTVLRSTTLTGRGDRPTRW